MKRPLLSSTAAIIVAALLSFAAFFDADTAQAQGSALVHNNSGCAIYLHLYDAATGAVFTYLVPPGGPTIISWPPGFTPTGALDAYGVRRPFVVPGGRPPGCTGCIVLGNLCCGNVCYDSEAGMIVINPCPEGC